MAEHEHQRKPFGHRLPQIIVEGVVRKSLKSTLITFSLTLFRLVELTFLVPLPREGSGRVPVVIRFWTDQSKGDAPGSVIIE